MVCNDKYWTDIRLREPLYYISYPYLNLYLIFRSHSAPLLPSLNNRKRGWLGAGGDRGKVECKCRWARGRVECKPSLFFQRERFLKKEPTAGDGTFPFPFLYSLFAVGVDVIHHVNWKPFVTNWSWQLELLVFSVLTPLLIQLISISSSFPIFPFSGF